MLHAGGASAFLCCGGPCVAALERCACRKAAGRACPAPTPEPPLSKGGAERSEAEGFLAVRRCDEQPGKARRNPSVRLRRPPPFDKGGSDCRKRRVPPWPPLRGGSARRRWGRELYGCPPFYIAARGLARLPLYGVPAAKLRAGHARPLRSARRRLFLLAHFFIFFALLEYFSIILHKSVAFPVPSIL